MPTRNISLTEHQDKLIERLIASGRYQNASEVMRHSMRMLEEHEAEYQAKLAALMDAAQLGLDDAAAGRVTHLADEKELSAFLSDITKDVLSRHSAKKPEAA